MDVCVGQIRSVALVIMLKVLKPEVPIPFMADQLGFDSESECLVFLQEEKSEIVSVVKDGAAVTARKQGVQQASS
eukprot:SAG31_NODE_3797_length_3874_cov_2.483444_2_plen_75_part_00